jgi:hypothetical protein
LDAFPFNSEDSLDDDAFEALMGINDPGDGLLPDTTAPPPSAAAPSDRNNLDTMPVEEGVLDKIAQEESDKPSPSPGVGTTPAPATTAESLDARIAYLQRHSCTCIGALARDFGCWVG